MSEPRENQPRKETDDSDDEAFSHESELPADLAAFHESLISGYARAVAEIDDRSLADAIFGVAGMWQRVIARRFAVLETGIPELSTILRGVLRGLQSQSVESLPTGILADAAMIIDDTPADLRPAIAMFGKLGDLFRKHGVEGLGSSLLDEEKRAIRELL